MLLFRAFNDFRLLLHQPIVPDVCSRAGSFRPLTDQGFEPSRAAATFKKMLKLSSITIAAELDPGAFALP
jgi:hypothetical protein